LATTGCEQKALRSAAKGDAQKVVGKAKGAIKDVADEVPPRKVCSNAPHSVVDNTHFL
jgi:hypothetical protein